MDMKHNENRLVPGQGQPLNLDKLKRLATGQSQDWSSAPSQASEKPRRFKRAGRHWAGALALGVLLAVVGGMALGKESLLDSLVGAPALPALPDEGLSPGEKERYWAMAAFEPTRFQALLGVRPDEGADLEEDARKFERLLSDREHPGLR